jgi:hypothetical protein
MPPWLSLSILDDPLVQTAALPLVAALFAALLIRLLGGPGRGAALAGAGIVLGFIAAYVAIYGAPSPEPRGAAQKLVYISIAGLAIGLLIDLWRAPGWIAWTALLAWPTLALAWLAENRLAQATPETWMLLGPLWLAVLATMLRLERAARRDIDAGIFMLVLCLGLGPIALFGRSAALAQFSFALAAAIGGFLLLNWPKPRFAFGSAVLIGVGGTITSIGAILVLFSRAERWALAVLLLGLVADPLCRRILPKAGPWRAPALAIAAGVPVLVAIAIAYYVVRESP